MTDLYYLDASFIIALLIKNHSFSKRAVDKSHELKEKSFAISYLFMDELLYGMTKYSNDRDDVYKTIRKFLNSGNFVIVGSSNSIFEVEEYLRTWKSSKLKPRDAMHLHIMKSNNIRKIVTFDKDYISKQQEFGIIVV